MKTISDKIKSILLAATHSSDIHTIAGELGIKVQVVSGSLATIKKEGLATYDNHNLVITKAGLEAINVTTKKVKKKDLVAALYSANVGDHKATKKEHTNLVDLVAVTLNKTKIEARVYVYNHEKLIGLR